MTAPRKPGRPPREGGPRVVAAARLDPVLAAQVRAAAWAARQTLSEWIRQAIQERLDRSATTSEEAP